MIQSEALYQSFKDSGIEFFLGVPDSVLKSVSSLFGAENEKEHIITANEGAAVALASGIYLASQGLSLVYMQNSGLGNAINPLLSLADSSVYGIPMVLLIGWRGSPEREDEPQHMHQGQITPSLLETMDISTRVLASDTFAQQVQDAVAETQATLSPVALLVPFGSVQGQSSKKTESSPAGPTRATVIQSFLEVFTAKTLFVGTTGLTGRELYHLRQIGLDKQGLDFLNVGAMGHASQIALGMALQRPDRQVVCLDGDGSVLMHSGNLGTVGHQAPPNFKHLLLNNGTHESVGGQSVCSPQTDFCLLAQAFGYIWARRVAAKDDLTNSILDFKETKGPALLEVMIKSGSIAELGRPEESPADRKVQFMERLGVCKQS